MSQEAKQLLILYSFLFFFKQAIGKQAYIKHLY